jgi:hypothetical protein
MFFELLAPNNTCTFNSSIANKYGLDCAIYLSELLRQYVGQSIQVDFASIRKRTTLSKQKQNAAKDKLISKGILIEDEDHCIDIDIQKLLKEFAGNTDKIIVESGSFYEDNTAASLRISSALKKAVRSNNPQFREAMYNWIDTVRGKEGFLSKSQVQIAEDTVIRHCGNNLPQAIQLIEIATACAYKNIEWAWEQYTRDIQNNKKKSNSVDFNKQTQYNNTYRESEMERDDIILSGEVF